jgi:hypothetical protein
MGTVRLVKAVKACRLALQEQTRKKAPRPDLARTQSNLGFALKALGERETGTRRLEEAVRAYDEALKVRTPAEIPLAWAASFGNQGIAKTLLAERTRDHALAETATKQIEAAYQTARSGGDEPWAAYFETQLSKAQAICDQLNAK